MRAARRAWAALLLAALALPAAAGALLDAAAPDATTQRLIELENQGRATPTDSARALEALIATTSEFGAQRLEGLTVQGLMLATSFQPDAAERAAAQLDAWGSAPHAADAHAAALLVRAQSTARRGNLQQAEAIVKDAMQHLPASLAPRARYRYVAAHAYIANESGKLEDAVRLYHEALALADQQPEAWRRAEARTSLAYSYVQARQVERASALCAEALAIADAAQDWQSLGRAHVTLGIALDELGDHEGERRSFELGLAYARRAGAKHDEVSYLADLSDFFLKKADYKTAGAQAERALALARELHDTGTETVALANMGLAQISLHQLELGKRHVHEAIAIEDRRGSVTGQSELWRELGTYLEKAGDLPDAIAAYQRHRRLATTLLRADEQKAILALQEQYDADGRARALALLNRQSALKAEQLERGDLQQRLWALLALAFVLLFGVVALLVRRVRQTNALLTTSNEQLQMQSERDPLTGLANRRHFQARMRQLAADGRLAGTYFLIDLDHFKSINDRYGHGAGDAVLVEVARRLRQTLRDDDLVARWGGEEFLVVVRALAPEQVDTLARRLLTALDDAPVTVAAKRIAVSGSIGYATFPIGPAALPVPWERAIDLVDTAMYLAKAHGRHRAYGVRVMQACDEAALDAITHSLEASWRAGRVTLTLLQGRAPLVAATAVAA